MRRSGRWSIAVVLGLACLVAGAAGPLLGTCGPFTDVAADAFCPFVLEIFTLGITTGTTPTTYDPAANVSRLQMAAFLSRTVDGVLERVNRRTAMRQLAVPPNAETLPVTTLAVDWPGQLEFDGEDLWVSSPVVRVRASDGKLLETWTGVCCAAATNGNRGMVLAMGKVFIVGGGAGGALYRIDPAQPPGAATAVTGALAAQARGIAFDGAVFFVTNSNGTVSIVTPGATLPWSVTTTTGGYGFPNGALYDGSNVWITDFTQKGLKKLDSSAAVLQTVTVGSGPMLPAFDGTNIWVPNSSESSVSVVRASTGAVLTTTTAFGMSTPNQAAFDGERIAVTDSNGVFFFKAADASPAGSATLGPLGFVIGNAVASDGVHFWVTFATDAPLGSRLVRF